MTTFKKTSPKTGKTSWFCSFYYKDYDGTRKQKKKEGFHTQREAKEYEQNFLNRYNLTSSMTFGAFAELYLQDMQGQLRPTSIQSRQSIISKRILPFFHNIPINAITPAMVKQWQTQAFKNLKHDTIVSYHSMLSIMLNYAIKIYGLKDNAAKIAGCPRKNDEPIGVAKFHLWTLEQFQCFMTEMKKDDATYRKYGALFLMLFCSGMRIGEALALTTDDLDFHAGTIRINKSLTRLNRKSNILPPKTPRSNRTVMMPSTIMAALQDYICSISPLKHDDILFAMSRSSIRWVLERYTKFCNLPRITIHDLRHSHASFLIEKGFSIIAIRDRLGHENVQITLDTYSHLYPNKQSEIAEALKDVITI